MQRKGYIILVMTLLLIAVPVNASIDWELNCSGGILYKNASFTVNNEARNITQNVSCGHLGCSDNGIECKTSENIEPEFYIGMAIGLGILIFALAYVSVKMREEHWAISVLFLVTALFTAMIMLAILMGFSTQTQDSAAGALGNAYTMLIFVIMLFLSLIHI